MHPHKTTEERDDELANAEANLYVLKVTAISFFVFVVSEVIGAVMR